MSIGYTKFLSQFNASGSQKAQGYDASHFDGLTQQEQDAVFTHLERELIAPGVIGWLFHLNPQKAERVLLEYLADEKNTSGRHRVYISLFHYTGKTLFLEQFERGFSQFYDWEKADAIKLYNAYAPAGNGKCDFLKSVIIQEPDAKTVKQAADSWLRQMGVPTATEMERKNFTARRNLLESTHLADKLTGLDLTKPLP